jgi:hypothetical protein
MYTTIISRLTHWPHYSQEDSQHSFLLEAELTTEAIVRMEEVNLKIK